MHHYTSFIPLMHIIPSIIAGIIKTFIYIANKNSTSQVINYCRTDKVFEFAT